MILGTAVTRVNAFCPASFVPAASRERHCGQAPADAQPLGVSSETFRATQSAGSRRDCMYC